jgi:hypothetical protein
MGSRYFFITFLPSLSFDAVPELSLHEVEFFLRLNLSHGETKVVEQLYSLYDLENIRSFFMDLPMTAVANIPHDDLREMLENDECPIPALEPFFSEYHTLEQRKLHVQELIRVFFKAPSSSLPPFVRKYFWIEHISRCLMAHLRAKALGKTFEIDAEELGFDIHDTKSWPDLYVPLLSMWQSRQESPLDLEQSFSKWKFDTIAALTSEMVPFSFDSILAYLLQLRLVESRRELKTLAHQNIPVDHPIFSLPIFSHVSPGSSLDTISKKQE